jgi:hypothetical protein
VCFGFGLGLVLGLAGDSRGKVATFLPQGLLGTAVGELCFELVECGGQVSVVLGWAGAGFDGWCGQEQFRCAVGMRLGVLALGAVQCDFGVGDGDGAGCGFATSGLGGLDAGGLRGLVLRPPCRIYVGGVLVCLGRPFRGWTVRNFQGGACARGERGARFGAGWPGLTRCAGGLALGADGGFGLVGLGGELLPPRGAADRFLPGDGGFFGGVGVGFAGRSAGDGGRGVCPGLWGASGPGGSWCPCGSSCRV